MRRAAGCLALYAALVAGPALAGPRPDPLGALGDLAGSTLDSVGAGVGGAGLLGGALVGATGDLAQALDGNRVSRPVLRGVGSGIVHRAAFAIAWGGTRLCEVLRREPIERLPEPLWAYTEAAYGAGRFTSFVDGLGALWLSLGDAIAGPARFGLRLVGARGSAERLEARRREAAVRWLGPPPAGAAALRARRMTQ